MIRHALLLAPLLMSACVYGEDGAPPLAPLAKDRTQPAGALIEHVLTRYFERVPASPNVPTVCVSFQQRPLDRALEQALIARFPRLAPLSRCAGTGNGVADAITGGAAQVIEVYAFTCDNADNCSGWATVPREPSVRYGLRWQNGAWQFARDMRLIAE